jgi:single-strand DNA-binding protein
MATFNRVIMAGNLTRDPEYKQLTSGQPVCRLGLASNRQYKNRQTGDTVQEVCFVDVDVWGAQAESCRQYLQKGRPVLIEGRLKFDSWDDNGQKRSRHTIVADRVVFLGSNQEFAGAERYDEPTQGMGGLNPNDPAERKLMDQIEEIKAKTAKKAAPKKEESALKTGEIDFADVQPFQDDLPF